MTSGSVLAGNYILTITATNSDINLSHSTTVTLTVGDFALATAPAAQTIFAGNNTSFTIKLGSSNGFTGPVTLSVSDWADGLLGAAR